MKIYQYRFNGRSDPVRISVGVTENGETLIWFPGCTEPAIVQKGNPIEIDISGDGPGPDVCILVVASRDPTRL